MKLSDIINVENGTGTSNHETVDAIPGTEVLTHHHQGEADSLVLVPRPHNDVKDPLVSDSLQIKLFVMK